MSINLLNFFKYISVVEIDVWRFAFIISANVQSLLYFLILDVCLKMVIIELRISLFDYFNVLIYCF